MPVSALPSSSATSTISPSGLVIRRVGTRARGSVARFASTAAEVCVFMSFILVSSSFRLCVAGFAQSPPQMHDGIRAPRPPRLAALARPRRTRLAERAQHAEIAFEKRIGPAERAHRDVAGGPRADPADRRQRRVRLLDVRAGAQGYVTIFHGAREIHQRPCTRTR